MPKKTGRQRQKERIAQNTALLTELKILTDKQARLNESLARSLMKPDGGNRNQCRKRAHLPNALQRTRGNISNQRITKYENHNQRNLYLAHERMYGKVSNLPDNSDMEEYLK